MLLVGDIGNTETKICLINSKKKIVRKIIFLSKNITNKQLINKIKILKLKSKNIKKCLFCSVVPNTYKRIKIYLKKLYNIKDEWSYYDPVSFAWYYQDHFAQTEASNKLCHNTIYN